MNRIPEMGALQALPPRIPDPAGKDCLATSEAAQMLGLKRQQFQVVVRFLDIKPAYRGKARPNSRSESYYYASDDLRMLTDFLAACHRDGGSAVLKRIFSALGSWGA
jgi:hypothetical protein